jgi:hypothetical protein
MLALSELDITTGIGEFIKESELRVANASMPAHTLPAWLSLFGSTVGQWQHFMLA